MDDPEDAVNDSEAATQAKPEREAQPPRSDLSVPAGPQRSTGPPDNTKPTDRAAPTSGTAQSDDQLAGAEFLDRLGKIVLAVIPALATTLAVIGGATGGLGRLFRDDTGVAQASVGLIFVSFILAALARRPLSGGATSTGELQRGAVLLLISGIALIIGIAWVVEAQIAVLGNGLAIEVTGGLTSTSGIDVLDANVKGSGLRSSDRIVVLAFESSDRNGDVQSQKLPFYYSKAGPDNNGVIAVHVAARVRDSDQQRYPYIIVTAALGEDERDCDGAIIDGNGAADPHNTGCLTLLRSGSLSSSGETAPPASTIPSATSGPPSE